MKKLLFFLIIINFTQFIQAQNLLDVEGHAKIIGRLDITDKVNGTNVFLGNGAGIDNTTGVNNTAVGRNALFKNTTGKLNIAIGVGALNSNTTGEENIAIGVNALFGNNADKNTAIGSNVLFFNSTGSNNTAIGNRAAYQNTSGYRNTAMGASSLYSNTTSHDNTAIGTPALFNNTIGFNNTAIGRAALDDNTIGSLNVVVGFDAASSSINGTANTVMGAVAFSDNTTGDAHTATGRHALEDNTTGDFNTAFGYKALNSNETGALRTAFGVQANTVGVDYTNNTGIGYATVCSATNQVRLGNIAVTSIGGFAGWTNVSDRRFKSQVKENVQGLDFIMKLRPVTYHLNPKAVEDFIYKNYGVRDTAQWEGKYDAENLLHTGFIAQEVEAAAKELGYDFSGVDKPKNDKDFYGLRYAKFTVPLVKAVQEQQHIIESGDQKIDNLALEMEQQDEQLLELQTQLTELAHQFDEIKK